MEQCNSPSDHTYSSLNPIKGCYKKKRKKSQKPKREKKKYFLKKLADKILSKWCIIAEGTANY